MNIPSSIEVFKLLIQQAMGQKLAEKIDAEIMELKKLNEKTPEHR